MDKKKCLKCNKEYQPKKEASKFCSTSCRVMWHRGHKKDKPKDEISKFQLQVLYNSIKDMADRLNLSPVTPSVGKAIDLPKDFVEVKNLGTLSSYSEVQDVPEPKSLAEYIQERIECESQDEFRKWEKRLNDDPYLSEKQKEVARTANI